MLRLKLIEVHHSREKYLTTEKGQEYLQLCIDLQRLFETDEVLKGRTLAHHS